MQFAHLNGVAIHYQTIGAPAGRPTIVFSNSLGTDFRIWRDVIVRLAGDFRIIAYDKRGHGLSDIGETPYAMDDHVQDLAALLDHLQIRDAIVCGLSVGGVIAQGLYAERKDLVRALILCDTAPKIGDEASWNSRIAAVEEHGVGALADGIMEKWYTPAFRRPDNPEFSGHRNMLVRSPVEGYVATCAALRDCDYTSAARQIGVPTLCVVGDEDGSTPPELVLAMAKLIPGAHFEMIEGAGHMVCVEKPDALVAMIRAFAGGLQD